MKIRQLILKNVNNFQDFSYHFEDSWSGDIPTALLLSGPNGCGKTTLLHAISFLWQALGEFLTGNDTINVTQQLSQFASLKFMAAEFVEVFGYPIEPVWIFIEFFGDTEAFSLEHQNDYVFGGHIQSGYKNDREKDFLLSIEYYPPGRKSWKKRLLDEEKEYIEALRLRYQKNRLGGLLNLPNITFFESESRLLLKVTDNYSITPEQEAFNWFAKYQATSRREGSIQNYLFTLKAINEGKYQHIVNAFNDFWIDKSLVGFDGKTGDLLVELENGTRHSINMLSSGEKQVLLMIAFIIRESHHHGIVMIDEPDLHLHVSLQTAFVSYLKDLMTKEGGQLILASHAPKIWERFHENERVRLDNKRYNETVST